MKIGRQAVADRQAVPDSHSHGQTPRRMDRRTEGRTDRQVDRLTDY